MTKRNHRRTNIVVHWTKDFDSFILLDPNRPVIESHVKSLMHEISDKGFREECFIQVIEMSHGKLGVLAGQHRLESCKRLNCEIAYIIIDKPMREAVYNVMVDHATTKGWTLDNYLKFFDDVGVPDYKRVIKFADDNSLSPRIAVKILTVYQRKPGLTKSLSTNDAIKRGQLKISDEDIKKANSVLGKVNRIRYFDSNRYHKFNNDFAFISATSDLASLPAYEEDNMLKQLEANPLQLARCSNIKDYLQVLQSIYNKKRQSHNRINLVSDKN
jgi:hypothetical protein